MKDFIDGPPTKPGEYRIVTSEGLQLWGYYDGEFLRDDKNSVAVVERHRIAKHASIAPAPEWLPAERLGEFVGKPVWLKYMNGQELDRCGIVKALHHDGLRVEFTDGRVYLGSAIERFCPITLPDPPPAASQRDRFEEAASKIDRVVWNEKLSGMQLNELITLLRERFEPLQQENERLKRELAETDWIMGEPTKPGIYRVELLCGTQYWGRFDGKRFEKNEHTSESLPPSAIFKHLPIPSAKSVSEQHNEATAEPECPTCNGNFLECPTCDGEGTSPALPTPRRFRCKGQSSLKTYEGWEVAGIYTFVTYDGALIADPYSVRLDSLKRDMTDLEFLPEPLESKVFKVRENETGKEFAAEKRDDGWYNIGGFGCLIADDSFHDRFTRV